MKMRMAFTLAVFVMAAAIGATSPALAQQKKQLRLSHPLVQTEQSESATSAWIFRNWVNENSETLEVRIYPSNALGEERAVYEGMQLGSGATCAIGGAAILGNFVRSVGVLDLPFLWDGYDHVHRALDGQAGAMITRDLEKVGFKIMAFLDSWGARTLATTKREVKAPEHIKGLKIRTIPAPVWLAAINLMGANATPMAFGEIYTALQSGVLDGFEHSASTIYSQKFYEVTKYLTLTHHILPVWVIACSVKEWNAMSPKDQSIVMAAATLARDIERGLAPGKEAEALTALKAKGMVVNTIDTAAFRKAALEIQDKFAAERGATELLKLIRDAR
ncbi:MAG: TRAP transporter substrate-binding protein [Alphaproteobacteria bacterium]|nr:TRAP transporter substrate-binding protein [Alphaproteobacteria bacterium]